MLSLLNEGIDLLQPFQIPHGTGEEEAEDHVDIVGESLTAFLLIADEIDHHIRLVEADGNGHIAFMDDAERHSSIRCAALHLFDVRNT